MIPAARLQAAIEVLDAVFEAVKNNGRAADDVLRTYFRTRRYAGSKDRRAIGELVYGVLRDYQRISWALGQWNSQTEEDHKARAYFVAHLALNDGIDINLFTGEGYGPKVLWEFEKALILKITELDGVPLYARANCPMWLMEMMDKRFKFSTGAELLALNERAPLDLRINTLKSNVGNVLHILLNDKYKRKVTPLSPHGIRVEDNPNISNLKAYRDGLIEVQDEAAQVASILTGVQPGMTVIDLCAGGGGKSLAMAALMENKGKIHALDISDKRLRSLSDRAKRAGDKIIKPKLIAGFDKIETRRDELAPFKGKADVVILDVPCSGTGTWRRSPELRLRLTENSLGELQATQMKLMEEGAKLLKPGGRLIYMTCSVLEGENEDQIKSFLKIHNTWRQIGYTKVWGEVLETDCPKTLSSNPKCLQLSPHTHGTDGFFVGIMKKPN